MTLKDHNYLKNVYLLSVISEDNMGKVIETFKYTSSNKLALKYEIISLLKRQNPYQKWDQFLNPKYFKTGLKEVLESLK